MASQPSWGQPSLSYPNNNKDNEAMLECENGNCSMMIFNFIIVSIFSYFGLAYVTRPERSGNNIVDCLDCGPRQNPNDYLAKTGSVGAIFWQWTLAYLLLFFSVTPWLLYFITGKPEMLLMSGFGSFLMFLPFVFLQVVSGFYFMWYFWTHGRSFKTIPLAIYVACVLSIFSWLAALVLYIMICFETVSTRYRDSAYTSGSYQVDTQPIYPQPAYVSSSVASDSSNTRY